MVHGSQPKRDGDELDPFGCLVCDTDHPAWLRGRRSHHEHGHHKFTCLFCADRDERLVIATNRAVSAWYGRSTDLNGREQVAQAEASGQAN